VVAATTDIASRVAELESGLPEALKPLAQVAYNYRWSWHPDGEAVFRDLDADGWERAGRNPVRFLYDLGSTAGAAADAARIRGLRESIATELARDAASESPVAYICAEYGVHESLPIYSGGLGVLAGDTLKEASDRGLPFVAVGLLYRRGYFRQRLDASGRQVEYWIESDPQRMPMARVTSSGAPLELSIDVYGRATRFHVWRVDVGRVPLFLIDADVPGNDPVQRWYTARLYEGNRALRLAQYALLGVGGVRVLQALGIEPAVYHLNEGHPALAALALAADEVAAGAAVDEALARVRDRFVFTTHTPVPAGNETYGRDELLAVLAGVPEQLGVDEEELLGWLRTQPGDREEPVGLTQLALRCSRGRNAVSRLHGEVARRMWQPLFAVTREEDVPITHVTNGAHLPTFLSAPFRALFDRYLGEGWLERAGDPRTWDAVQAIPDAELWEARCSARDQLVSHLRRRSVVDRLQRGEEPAFAGGAAEALDGSTLTLGFARRLATYKRVHLLVHDPARAVNLLTGDPPVQVVIAGKAHPRDDEGKRSLESLFAVARQSPDVARRAVVLEDYDLALGRLLVAGCDVWINLPRRPMEASGTSGMKSTFNGGLQLSVLDGWWAEAYDGTNGWAIEPGEDEDPDAADAQDAGRFYDLLEREVIPLFHDRSADGVPHGWCAKVKQALVTCAARFTTARMLDEYVERIYRSA
jgi:starch phosphorylase